MRELYRLNRNLFPDHGALLFILRSTEDENGIREEMLHLADKTKVLPIRHIQGESVDG